MRTRATRATGEPGPGTVAGARSRPRSADESAAALGSWLADGAARLVGTLREAGPDAGAGTVAEERPPAFWARRMAHETAVHRADAALAAGTDFDLDEELALDALDEWMDFASRPEVTEAAPGAPPLLGPGRTLYFHATGPAPDTTAGEWLVDLTGGTARRRAAHAKAAVSVRGPLTDLLLFLYRRPTPSGSGGVEILGDEPLLDLWLERSGSWLRK